jgi:hypothetical protein
MQAMTMTTTESFTFKGYQVEIVFSGAPGWFDFYINGKPWGCARASQLTKRITEVIALKEAK